MVEWYTGRECINGCKGHKGWLWRFIRRQMAPWRTRDSYQRAAVPASDNLAAFPSFMVSGIPGCLNMEYLLCNCKELVVASTNFATETKKVENPVRISIYVSVSQNPRVETLQL